MILKQELVLCLCLIVCCVSQNEENGFMPTLPIGVFSSDNPSCRLHSTIYRDNLMNLSLWAYESGAGYMSADIKYISIFPCTVKCWKHQDDSGGVLDATAMSTTGLLRGSSFQMGNFEECLTARAPFKTKYCLATITANIPEPEEPREDELSLYFEPDENVLKRLFKYKDETQLSRNIIKMGWCIPASCMSNDLEKTLDNHLRLENTLLSEFNVTYMSKIDEKLCQTQSDLIHFDNLDISFCILCLIVVLLMVIGNCYEIGGSSYGGAYWKNIISAFSIRKNLLELARKDDKNSDLQILHGVRTLLMFVIIICHRSITFASSAVLNFDEVEKEYRFSLGCSIYYGVFSVDIFFMISGLLVTYILMNQFEKEKVNPVFMIVLRYISLCIRYFLLCTLFNHTGTGPLWKLFVGDETADCRKNWWTNLLYISNYINTDHMCMIQSWYLPCDFHYFIVTLGILFIMKKQNKIGLFILIIVFVASMVIPFLLISLYQRHSVLYFYPDMLSTPKQHPDFGPTYVKSHTRATPYFVGVICGYLYYKFRGTKFNISMVKSMVISIASVFLVLGTMIIGNIFYDPHHSYNAIESGAHAALHRLAWTVGFVGILFIANFGHAKYLKKMLTWQTWTPLSKLTFSAYLIHFQFQIRDAASFVNPRRVGLFEVLNLSLSDLVLSFSSALVLYLTIEAPLRYIFKQLLMPSKLSKNDSEQKETNSAMKTGQLHSVMTTQTKNDQLELK